MYHPMMLMMAGIAQSRVTTQYANNVFDRIHKAFYPILHIPGL
jgi:hypothetical protein